MDLKNVNLHIYKEISEERGDPVFNLIAINEELKIKFIGGIVLVTENINEAELLDFFVT